MTALAHQEIVYRYARRIDKFCEKRRGKVKYETQTKALKAALELSEAFGEDPQRAYKCEASRNPNRPHWHLTRRKIEEATWSGEIEYVVAGDETVTVYCGPAGPNPGTTRRADENAGWKRYVEGVVSQRSRGSLC